MLSLAPEGRREDGRVVGEVICQRRGVGEIESDEIDDSGIDQVQEPSWNNFVITIITETFSVSAKVVLFRLKL